ncbi:unnamed protein product [Moneuplotes crassus]|uniref:Uncharacterized protein n=1 Tax=Euplotes crassus TaxID=5936 RepID=A0AAD1Y3W0_EUPCR|nr:unnamed protein product [Moneuplotes crassus]
MESEKTLEEQIAESAESLKKIQEAQILKEPEKNEAEGDHEENAVKIGQDMMDPAYLDQCTDEVAELMKVMEGIESQMGLMENLADNITSQFVDLAKQEEKEVEETTPEVSEQP